MKSLTTTIKLYLLKNLRKYIYNFTITANKNVFVTLIFMHAYDFVLPPFFMPGVI